MSGNFNLADYVTVDERIDKYWAAHPKPEGSIQTEIIWVSNDGNSVAIRATVYQGDRILATGIAQEERLVGLDKWGKPAKGANTSSWWENCETSAIGRAIANMGMSLSKRASREEMQKVQRYADSRESADEHDDDSPYSVNDGVIGGAPKNTDPGPAPTRTAPPRQQPQAAPPAPPAGNGSDPADDALLIVVNNDLADPGTRVKYAHNFLAKAKSVAELNQRDQQLGALPEADRRKLYTHHRDRLGIVTPQPASYAG